METVLISLGMAVVIFVAAVILIYNKLVKARNQMREGWSGIEVQLKRRHELVPALVECVKGYQSHEGGLLEAVVRERTEAQAARGAGEAGGAEKVLGRDLGKIVALAEAYPDLKADKSFRGLMGDLVEIEDQIQYARRYYNGSVRDLNNAIESFPSNLVAGRFGFEVGDFFEVETASERLPPDLATALKGG
ncbi:MAG: LemA family protein [Verrucomicrobiota bacterium]|nr:LemA family protein [Verrucomicrobiota bacterium]